VVGLAFFYLEVLEGIDFTEFLERSEDRATVG
jgi:hypothetical protein